MLKVIMILLLAVLTACGSGERENGDTGFYEPPENGGGKPATVEEDTEQPDIPAYDNYRVVLEIDPAARTVYGISQITFTNRTGKELETVVLQVYFSAFGQGFYPPPFFNESTLRIFRGPQIYGRFNIHYASLDNEELHHEFSGTVLTLHLPEPLQPDVTIELVLQYDAYIPKIAHHTGGNAKAMWLGMFLPVLASFGEDDWHRSGYYPAGSPFLLDTANYQVTITTPIRYVVVGTGLRSEEIIEDTDTRITRFTAHATRDFALAVSAYFNHAHTSTESGIDIHLYYYTEGLETDELLNHARLSMEYFEFRVGSYPFGHVTIVEAHTKLDSTAFSQMILIDSWYLQFGDLRALSRGLGDQWFAHIVGTNRIQEPWLSDGLTRFIQAGIFYDEEELTAHMERVHSSIAVRDDLYLTRGLGDFSSLAEFDKTHGRKAMLMIYALYRQLGEEIFWEFINRYYHEFSFGFATAEDFKRLAEEHYGNSLQAFFDEWIKSGTVPPLP